MSGVYDVNDQVRLTAQFRDVDGNAADPSGVVLAIRDGAGVQSSYTYGADPIEKDGVGAYHFDVSLTNAGTWVYRWEGTANPQTAEEGQLIVQPSQITTAPPDKLASVEAILLNQLSAPQEIETPQLGRVVNRSVADIVAALHLLRQEAALAAGISTAGVITVGYCRGLGPMKENL